MGKIRVKVLGDESLEKKQQKEAKQRAELKKADKVANTEATEGKAMPIITETQKSDLSTSGDSSVPSVVARKPSKHKENAQKSKHSKKYQSFRMKVDKNKIYSLSEALSLLPQLKLSRIDETVELHINTTDKGVSGSMILPHGNGKKIRVIVANQSEDAKAVEELVKNIEAGKIDFDILIATPDTMPKLARVAKFLGPRGLMPNPKSGTVTTKPQEAAKKYEGGQINFKTEAKFPLIHLSVGKISFGEQKISENVVAAIQAIQLTNVKSVTVKSTMSPGIKIDVTSL